MIIKYLLQLIALILIQIIHLSLLPTLPFLHYLNLPLVVLVLMAFTANRTTCLIWFLALGFLMDTWSFHFFGMYIFIYTFIMVIVVLALDNFITNKSLYAYLFLLLIAILLFDLFWLIVLNWPLIIDFSEQQLLAELKKLGVNLLVATLFYHLINWLSHSLQSVIIIKNKN